MLWQMDHGIAGPHGQFAIKTAMIRVAFRQERPLAANLLIMQCMKKLFAAGMGKKHASVAK